MNPWNDIECGDHYVRAMSSWSLLLTATNFGWDAHLGELTLGNRMENGDLTAPFFAAPAWGQFQYEAREGQTTVTLKPVHGEMQIQSIVLPGVTSASSVELTLNNKTFSPEVKQDERGLHLTLPETVNIGADMALRIDVLD